MAKLIKEFKSFEPLKTNRWLIKMNGVSAYLFKGFKLRNQEFIIEKGSKKGTKKMGLKLDLSFMYAIGERLELTDIFDCKNIKISFLDPIGEEVDFYDMDVSLDTYNLEGNYSVDDILTSECSFWVSNIETITSWSKDRETLKNYLEKNKKEVV
jgi:hypothetical protein